MNGSEIRRIARQKLTKNALNYYESGADGEQTLSENCKAYNRLQIRPQIINNNHANINLKTEVLGHTFDIPICLAPTAMQKMAHPDGEVGTAKAASAFGTCMGVSTLSTTSYENIVSAVPEGVYLMQLYIYKNRSLSEKLIRRAEKAGFKAIVLTVDTPILGRRIADVKEKFRLPSNLELDNYSNIKGIDAVSSTDGSGLMSYVSKNIESTLSWNDVVWVRSITKLPILLKGILTREGAVECLKHDVQGIIVSNHGGRQLDGVPATIEALPEVVHAVGGMIPVFVDGGIRRGSDVFKALALGAKAVFLGRPVLYGLAYNGTEGVKEYLQVMVEELKKTMVLTGCQSIKDINSSLVVHESIYGRYSSTTTNDTNWELTPDNPVCIGDIKESARQSTGKVIGDNDERRNTDSFRRLRFRPHRLRGISKTDTTLNVLGMRLDIPIYLDLSVDGINYEKEAINAAHSFGTYVEISKCENQQLSNFFFNLNISQINKEDILQRLSNIKGLGCKGIVLSVKNTEWKDVKWLDSNTKLPIILKGILTKEDAIECLKNNVKGIIISNEYQNCDSSVVPIDVLPEIANIISNKIPIFIEGGISNGTDILKALALGATAVVINKPVQWGFVHKGEEGIKKVLEILKDELQRAMLLAGTSCLKEVTSSLVVPESYYWNVNSALSKL